MIEKTVTPSSTSELFRSSLVWDTHSGFMPDPAADLDNLDIWKRAGVTHLSVNVGFDLMPWYDCVRTIAAFRKWIEDRPERFMIAKSALDVRAAKAAGKMSISFDLEGMIALDGRVEMVSLYHHLGVRQILFAYNRSNDAGGGCHDEDRGLTPFGRAVVDEMNRLGMFVDVSHAGYRTSMDVMEYSNRPVIFSHSNPSAVHPHGRNISDEQIRACAKTGGVVGAVGVSLFVGDRDGAGPTLADHVEHLLDVAGPEHVGIGLDYGFPVDVADIDQIVSNNPDFWPESEGYHDGPISFVPPSELSALADELTRRGHGDEVIRGVLGKNYLRLADQLWR